MGARYDRGGVEERQSYATLHQRITNELRLRRAARDSGVHRRRACRPLEAVLGGIEERCLVGA